MTATRQHRRLKFSSCWAADVGGAETDVEPEPDGGDSACWLDQVCPECGRMIESDDHPCNSAPPPAFESH